MLAIDLETIPTQDPERKAELIESVEVKCPHTTKAATAEDLGLSESECKFIYAADLKQRWIDEVGSKQKHKLGIEAWKKTALDPDEGEIVSIALSADGGEVATFCRNSGISESEILTVAWNWIGLEYDRASPSFVAHKKSFDLPYLYKRSVINGTWPTVRFDPYSRDHICTMELWNGFNGKIGLDRLAKLLGFEGKTGEGCQVFDWWENGEYDKISKYNKEDVELLIDVYNRLTFND